MANKITRRQAVLGVSSTLVLPVACSTTPIGSGSAVEFVHGVASGDPGTSSIVIWTRVSGATSPLAVDWYVATDKELLDVVAHGQFTTSAQRDYTVKPVVEGLLPGREYYYQFVVNGVTSPPGRTKTLPVGHLERLVLGIVTCSNYPFGWFNAYEVIANDDDIDLVVHLGDYIYEYRALGGYGGETGRRIGRTHQPGHEIVSLDDYRVRHAQYKTDPGSIAMHARHPLVIVWDDHESANNPWMEGAANHQSTDGDWFARRAASMQAFYEWLPVRDPSRGGTWERYWRHFKFGNLASLITLESRHTGRSKQMSWDGRLDEFASAADANDYYRDVVGMTDRNMLSSEMESFLEYELAESTSSGRRWRIIGSASVMARRTIPSLAEPLFRGLGGELGVLARGMLNELTQLGKLELPDDLDSWDGYPAARERFYQIGKNAGAKDLLVISGDSHSYWANALYDADGDSMGVELGSTGITSPRTLLDLGVPALTRFDELIAEKNQEVVWADGRYRGFIRLEITHDGAHADFVTVTNVETRDYETQIVHAMDIEQAEGTLRYV